MAVYNSSLESSEKGLEAYDLRDAEAFDSVEAMCKSDTVSLVVYAVAVFSHYDLIRSAIEAEKTSMLSGHFKKGIGTVIGLQAGVSPAYVALAMILESGRIGRPLATHISGSACTEETGKDIVKRYKCFKDPSHSALGRADDLANPDADDVAKIIVMDQDQVIESDVTKTVDDYVSLQGWTESGVAFTYCFRGEGAFDKGEGLV
ncbi:uncharacterized protein FOBCDRAFT_280844 [Fusarium oxysporum Fo47]|uniref:uncharacterized protein n=1 Tax=Fusarium oxysporum Fo47 TaxID=660027 RepID=UPI002869813E|nr:uncharacterized protein FOBCDRAFT_280844 [Fusarium oxysporum Fo47]QKD61210.2 hypothetical protein FOBCDRAFT_280844 [Fusarium oxysporum Fo47]